MKVNIMSPANKEGFSESQPLLVPADASDKYRVEVDIRKQDLTDPAFYMELEYQKSADNVKWEPFAKMTVIGGKFAWEENPWLQVGTKKLKGMYVRAAINVNRRTRIGLDIRDEDLTEPGEVATRP